MHLALSQIFSSPSQIRMESTDKHPELKRKARKSLKRRVAARRAKEEASHTVLWMKGLCSSIVLEWVPH